MRFFHFLPPTADADINVFGNNKTGNTYASMKSKKSTIYFANLRISS